MAATHSNSRELLALPVRQRPGNAELEQLRVTEYGVERSSELVGQDRQEFRLRLARRFCLEACLALTSKLMRPLFGPLSIRDVAQGDEFHLLVLPFRVHHPQLGVAHVSPAALDDVD